MRGLEYSSLDGPSGCVATGASYLFYCFTQEPGMSHFQREKRLRYTENSLQGDE